MSHTSHNTGFLIAFSPSWSWSWSYGFPGVSTSRWALTGNGWIERNLRPLQFKQKTKKNKTKMFKYLWTENTGMKFLGTMRHFLKIKKTTNNKKQLIHSQKVDRQMDSPFWTEYSSELNWTQLFLNWKQFRTELNSEPKKPFGWEAKRFQDRKYAVQLPELNPCTFETTWMTESLHRQFTTSSDLPLTVIQSAELHNIQSSRVKITAELSEALRALRRHPNSI